MLTLSTRSPQLIKVSTWFRRKRFRHYSSRADPVLECKQVLTKKLTQRGEVTIGMVGKYIELSDAYKSVNEALKHAGLKTAQALILTCVDSQDVESRGVEIHVEGLDAISVPGGFGDRGGA